MWSNSSKRPGRCAWALLLAVWLSLPSSFGFAEVTLPDEEYLAIEQALVTSDEKLAQAEQTLSMQSVLLETQSMLISNWLPSLDSFNLSLENSTTRASNLVQMSEAQEKRFTALVLKIEGFSQIFNRLDQASEKLSVYYARLEFELWLWRGATAGTLALLLLAILNK